MHRISRSSPILGLGLCLSVALLLTGCFGGNETTSTTSAPQATGKDAGAGVLPKDALDAILAECQPSTLSAEEARKELQWFIEAAKPFKGLQVKVLSETMPVHSYERDTLRKLFNDLTGIQVEHTCLGEGDVVVKLQQQMQSGENLYDIYVNDTDFIGTHYRSEVVIPVGDFMAGEGASVTSPYLDLGDFLGLEYASAGGKLYQLPDQQFANFYWFRHDWFSRDDIKQAFKEQYGYELGVPRNWSAYEDIAKFFTSYPIDGQKVYGHCDYGKKHYSLGWRFTDAWLAIAGVGDVGLPNGKPVDEWGIRVDEQDRPVGASVSRGGATNGPAAVYALTKFIEFFDYAPPGVRSHDFFETAIRNGKNPDTGLGDVAQQLFWYNCFVAPLQKETPHLNDANGNPVWRIAPNPHGRYWDEGMKLSYQDVGAWTMFNSTPLIKRQAGWLYAQFCVSKVVSLKKFIEGVAPIRKSDLFSDYLTEQAPKYGGLIEAYRSREVNEKHTPTGTNVPDYPALSKFWWQILGDATSGQKSPQQALNELAAAMDKEMAEMEEVSDHPKAPKLNPEIDPQVWLDRPGSPKAERPKPAPITVPYEQLLEKWKNDPIL